MTIQVFDSQATVCYLNRAFNDSSPSNVIFEQQLSSAKNIGDTAFANKFGQSFSGLSNAELSKKVLTNMGVLPTTDISVAALESALTDYFTAFNTDIRGFIVLQLANLLANAEYSTGSLSVYNAAAVAWNSEVSTSYMYSINTKNTTSTDSITLPILEKRFAIKTTGEDSNNFLIRGEKNDTINSHDWNIASDNLDPPTIMLIGHAPSFTELVISN